MQLYSDVNYTFECPVLSARNRCAVCAPIGRMLYTTNGEMQVWCWCQGEHGYCTLRVYISLRSESFFYGRLRARQMFGMLCLSPIYVKHFSVSTQAKDD